MEELCFTLCAPSLVLLLTLFALFPAHAGQWAVSLQAKGTDTDTVNGQATSYSWPGVAYYDGGPEIDDYEDSYDDQCDSSTINVTITPTLTWTPNNASDTSLPSTSVIVEDYVDTGAETHTSDNNLQVNDGFNDPVVTTGNLPEDGFYYWQGGFNENEVTASWGAHYSVKANASGASSLTLAPVTMSASGGGEQDYASSGVGLQVTPYPVTITLSGTLKDSNGNPILDSSGNQQILVGQSCTATLGNSIPAALLNNTANPPTYQWSVTGTTFQKWIVVSDPSNQSHTKEMDGYGPATSSTAIWYWNDAGPKPTPETVTCTVTLTPPAGQGSAFPVTVTQNVTVYLPGWSCTGTAGIMQINSYGGGGDGTDSCLYAGPTGASGRGMEWKATVSAPASCPALGVGVLEMVQIETPNVTYVDLSPKTVPLAW